jgi:hypothetical protein
MWPGKDFTKEDMERLGPKNQVTKEILAETPSKDGKLYIVDFVNKRYETTYKRIRPATAIREQQKLSKVA